MALSPFNCPEARWTSRWTDSTSIVPTRDLEPTTQCFFAVAHVVVDGNLGALCFGESGPTLIRSWETLAAITPPGQLRDLGLFGGFEAGDETGGTTLAFVNTLDDAGTLFQMSINLAEAENYPDELMLTMAHEFSHVFTATSPQIDRFAEPRDCNTYYNGEGCYTD